MRRLLIAAIVLVLCGSVLADDFLDSREDYRIQIRRKLGFTTSSSGAATDGNLDAFVSEGVAYTMPLIRSSKQEQTFVTSYETASYALDTTTIGVEAVWIKHRDTIKVLVPLPIAEWGEKTHEYTRGQKLSRLKRPSYYDWTDSLLYLFPVPTRGDTVHVMGWHDLGDITTDTLLTSIPQQYRVVVLNYATWKCALANMDSRAPTFKALLDESVANLNAVLNRREGFIAGGK